MNNENPFPAFYWFDINRRVYVSLQLAPVYREHFIKINIIDETEKEFYCNFGRTINKKSMLYRIDGKTRVRVFSEKEKDDSIYLHENLNKVISSLRQLDADTLREVESLIKNSKD